MKKILDLGIDSPNFTISRALHELIGNELMELYNIETNDYNITVRVGFHSETDDGWVSRMEMWCSLYPINQYTKIDSEDIALLQKVCLNFFGLRMQPTKQLMGIEYIADNSDNMIVLMDAIEKCGIAIYDTFYPIEEEHINKGEVYSPDGELLIRVPDVQHYRICEKTYRVAPIAFKYCPKLISLDVPYTVSETEMIHALSYCNNDIKIKYWDWPYKIDQMKSEKVDGIIDEFGFVYSRDGKRLLKASNIGRYRIPEGVEFIDKYAFLGCNFDHLDIPYTIQMKEDDWPIMGREEKQGIFLIWNRPYNDIDLIEDIKFIGDDFVLDDKNVAYSSNGKRLLFAKSGFNKNEYEVKDGVITICDFAFFYCKQYLTLILPKTVKVIGNNIFGESGGVIKIK